MSSLLTAAIQTLKTLSSSLVVTSLRPKRAKLLVTGLDNAGKTTLIHRMRNPDHDPASTSPPARPVSNPQSANSGTDIHLTTADGGVRQLWRYFLINTAVWGVIFVVDAADRERLAKTGALFADLLQTLREAEGISGLRKERIERPIPVLVLGNKIDSHAAVSEEELRGWLGLAQMNSSGEEMSGEGANGEGKVQPSRPVELFMCTVVMGQGYQAGLRWLAGHL
ncbi:ADP-ribosylation factor family-domain-containing protein [Cercophora newfieldiana]|uniref:ADP-ribosylation factor family-domain-containing protein n=1 Tax=Cercophora newfieldiana TaxID=92897 RepID=A0AA39YLV6_9PEZI|nr:ADP-ribosylation factor family-domain-containing protein [Cercophora newfieldiana]